MIDENQKDVLQLEAIKNKFEFEKSALLDHIRYLQKVPNKKLETRTRMDT